VRELQVAGEIAQAFLNATRPAEVYRVALDRVAPLVGASFGCVFLEREEGLLRVVAAYNWPQAFATYLSSMRVRVGNGPTGQAVAENRIVEVADVFSDVALADWWESARELGFVSSVSLPLVLSGRPVGAITLYFREPPELGEGDRGLLRLVADQLSATAEKAHLIDDLQRANSLLHDQNVELEARYRQAEEARRLKGEFLANVSHELRTPLTAVLGYAYILREESSGPLTAEQRYAVERIESGGASLLGLINDLLDLTHLGLGRTVVEPEICDAVALARAARSAAPPVPEGLELTLEAPDDPVRLYTDPTLVLRVLEKLVSNAYKFTERGRVTLRVRPIVSSAEDGGGLEGIAWEVEDTGIGIAECDHRAIFDEFRQVDGSATRRAGGAGLGLALSRGLARRMGGDITLVSEPGRGSTFTLTLPATLPRSALPARRTGGADPNRR
jgi:signal transduction histidine kinase